MKNPLKTLLGKPGPRQRGERFEQSAAAYLKKQGLVLLQANVHSRYGEIDLICEDGEYMVFVEVRYRDSSSHGTPWKLSPGASNKKYIERLSISCKKMVLLTEYPVVSTWSASPVISAISNSSGLEMPFNLLSFIILSRKYELPGTRQAAL